MKECKVCGKEYNDADPASRPPTCSENCFWLWTHVVDHKGKSCWISLEVYCGTHSTGYCYECRVFKVEQEVKKLGLNKDDLIGNY